MNTNSISAALQRVGELLAAGGQSYSIVAIGGAAMNLLGYVSRATTDVDIVAFGRSGQAVGLIPPPEPLPAPLLQAARIVARDMGLDPDWFNNGPAGQWQTGLPPGLETRVHWRDYGPLRVGLADRRDLIFFKLYAAADDQNTPASISRISSR